MWSQTCEYALRAVTYIAQHADENPVLAKEIAAEMNIPHQYLQKVLRELVRNRVLSSTRGIGGGFQLIRGAKEVRLAQVIEPFDSSMNLETCPFGNPLCGQANPCPVHERWGVVVDSYKSFLETTTLADLVEKEPKRAKRRR